MSLGLRKEVVLSRWDPSDKVAAESLPPPTPLSRQLPACPTKTEAEAVLVASVDCVMERSFKRVMFSEIWR